MDTFLYNLALAGLVYGWVRFCDWKLRPCLEQRKHEAELRQEGERILLQKQLDALGGLTMNEERLIMRAKGFK